MLRAKYKWLQRNSETSDRALIGTDSKLECRHCGKNGHRTSDCWTFPENKSKMESWKQRNSNGGNYSKGGSSQMTCHICNEKGHKSYQCRKGKCYKCNKLGHIRRNCPESGSNREVTQRTQESAILDIASETEDYRD